MRIRILGFLTLALAVAAPFARPVAGRCLPCAPRLEGAERLAELDLAGRSLVRYQADYARGLGADALRRRADQLGAVSGWRAGQEAGRLGDDRLTLRDASDASASLEIDTRSGSFLFNSGLARYRRDEETARLPREGEARELLFRHLARLELAPNRAEFGAIHEGGLNMAVALPDGSTKIYRKLVSLRIGRQVGGLPVFGASRIVAHLGEEGRLAGLVYRWPDLGRPEAVAAEELRSGAELQEEIEATIAAVSGGADRVVLTRAELVLYDDDRGVFEPAYHVQAQRQYSGKAGTDGRYGASYEVPFDFLVAVVRRPRAFYPSMEAAPVAPTDGLRANPGTQDDE